MNFEEAKSKKQELDSINSTHSEILQQFETNSMGLTPNHVRDSIEWQQAKHDFDRSFAELRNFNAWFVKEFRTKRK